MQLSNPALSLINLGRIDDIVIVSTKKVADAGEDFI
jgi:hypothetical protein